MHHEPIDVQQMVEKAGPALATIFGAVTHQLRLTARAADLPRDNITAPNNDHRDQAESDDRHWPAGFTSS